MQSRRLKFSFDLVSDLYLDHWSKPIEWQGLPPRLIGVVAGDLSADLDRTIHELGKIAKNYRHVIYIDGDLEHEADLSLVNSNRNYLYRKLQNTNINYLYEKIVIINGVAFVGANLWWCPGDQSTAISDDHWFTDMQLLTLHHRDLSWLRSAIQSLQNRSDVAKIVVVSHTVPNTELIWSQHNVDTAAVDASDYVELEDINNKISHWCFGHWPRNIDYSVNNCHYVSNPKGKPQDHLGFEYFPMRVEI